MLKLRTDKVGKLFSRFKFEKLSLLLFATYFFTFGSLAEDGVAPTDASNFVYGLPTTEKLTAAYPDPAKRARAIECLTNLEAAIREIIQKPEAKLDKVIEAHAETAILKVANAYLELQAVEHSVGRNGVDQERARQVKAALAARSGGNSDAEKLDAFYVYVYTYTGNLPESFSSDQQQLDLLKSLQRFSNHQMRGRDSTHRQMFTLTDGDIFAYQALYRKYRPDLRESTTPSRNLVEHMFHMVGRNFRSRTLADSDRGELCLQMGGQRLTGLNCSVKKAAGWAKKFEDAKKEFAANVKSELKKYLKRQAPYDTRPDSKCDEFINTNGDTPTFKDLKLKNAQGCIVNFMNGLGESSPFSNFRDLLDFLSAPRTPNLPVSALKPQLTSRRMFHHVNGCRIFKDSKGNYQVDYNLYLEHLPGQTASDATWFLNTGKPYTPDTQGYLNCPSPVQNYYNKLSNTNDTFFSENAGCIDRPVINHHDDHDFSYSYTVNIGDTHQDHITLIGTNEPISNTGETIRARADNSSALSGSGPLMERRLDLTHCDGYAAYTAINPTSIVVIKTNEAPFDNLGLTESKYVLQAKTQPDPPLTNGTYRWSCVDSSVVPEDKRASACSKISKYPVKSRSAEFDRLDVDYSVTVKYHSSVQRPEDPVSETVVIPKKKAVTFALTPIPASSDNTNTAAVLEYTGEESLEIINGSGSAWSWVTPPPSGSSVISPADSGCTLATPKIGCQYKFPIQAEGYTIEARWTRPGWAPKNARLAVSRSGILLTLIPVSDEPTQPNVKVKLTIVAPANIQSVVNPTLKWKCVGVENPSSNCNNTAPIETEVTFPRKNDNYTIFVEGTYTNTIGQTETPRSNTLPVNKVNIGIPRVSIQENPSSVNTNNLQLKGKLESSNGKPLPAGTFTWSCDPAQDGCTGTIDQNNFKNFPYTDTPYNVIATFTPADPSTGPPVTATKMVSRQYGTPEVDIAQVGDTVLTQPAKVKATLTNTTPDKQLPPKRSFKWICPTGITYENCGKDVVQNQEMSFPRSTSLYEIQAVYEATNNAKYSDTYPVEAAPAPAAGHVYVEQDNSDSYAKKETHVRCKAKYTITPPNSSMAMDTFKWKCPEGKCTGSDITVTGPGVFSEWVEFARDTNADYDVTAELVTKTPASTASEKCRVPKKEDVNYDLNVSEDKTPDDNAKAKFEATVFKGLGTADVSGEGKLIWTYKSPSGSDITKEEKSINPERGTEDIKGKVVFKVGDSEKDSEEFTIKKKRGASGSGSGDDIDPLPDIPPSPPPPRFQPMILPPGPGMMMVPGFD